MAHGEIRERQPIDAWYARRAAILDELRLAMTPHELVQMYKNATAGSAGKTGPKRKGV